MSGAVLRLLTTIGMLLFARAVTAQPPMEDDPTSVPFEGAEIVLTVAALLGVLAIMWVLKGKLREYRD